MAARSKPSLFDRLTGLVTNLFAPEPPSREDVERQLERLMAEYNRKVDALTRGLESGTVTVGQFVGSMPSLIREHHLAVAVASAGGVDGATPQTYALAQQKVSEQLAYFERWKGDLLRQTVTGKVPSASAIATRAKLYGKAALSTASQAEVQAKGVPPLPFYPRDGRTKCRVNCCCAWNVKTLDVVNGNYDCYYELGACSDHCPTCLARTRAANPLKVRGGVIVNFEKYQAANLYA